MEQVVVEAHLAEKTCIICRGPSLPENPLNNESRNFFRCRCRENLFHRACFDQYIKSSPEGCPVCRAHRFINGEKFMNWVGLIVHSAIYSLMIGFLIYDLVRVGGIGQMPRLLSTVMCSLIVVFGLHLLDFLLCFSQTKCLISVKIKLQFFRPVVILYRIVMAICSVVIIASHGTDDTLLTIALILQFMLELVMFVVDVFVILILYIFFHWWL